MLKAVSGYDGIDFLSGVSLTGLVSTNLNNKVSTSTASSPMTRSLKINTVIPETDIPIENTGTH